MSDDRFTRVREIFLAGLEQEPARRPAFLDQACGSDGELRRDVESLLLHHRDAVEETAAGPPVRISTGSASTDEPARFESGHIFAGRYRIVAELGHGGMGEVYRAHDLVLAEPVALKFLPRSGRRHLERLLNEVRMARQVTHPNVCRVYDFGEADGETYMTMEYIDGEDLASLLARIGRLPQDKLLDLAHQLCAGLAAAHAKGVLHRDLKPANIMIDGRGQARITDFGIASEVPSESSIGLPERGLIVGTPAYMSPEQLAGGIATAQSDLYALGLVLHEMATGQPVFSASTPAQFAELHRTAQPTPPSHQVTHLDPDLEAAILRCLEKDPRDRPASAREVAAELPGADQLALALAAGQTPAPEVVAAARTDDGLAPGIAAALLTALLAILTGILVLGDRAYPTRARWADQPPAVMVERCQRMLERLGHGEAEPGAGDRAWGFYPGGDGVGKSGEELFWYRRSPEPLVPTHFAAIFYPRVDFNDPPPFDNGMVRMLLDHYGRLLALRAVVEQNEGEVEVEDGDAGGATVDWAGVLAAAGFDPASLTAATPRTTPPVFADQRTAWTSSEVRIEAAAHQGRVVFFATETPAEEEGEGGLAPDWDLLWQIYFIIGDALFFLLALGAVVLARINLRAGRGDLRGARRLATFVVALNAASWVFEVDHLPSWDDLSRWELTLGRMLIQAAVAWLAYIALEPVVRRWWPRSLISWSRLLSGRLRDPLVGRSLLIGALVGAGWGLLTALDRLATVWIGLEPAPEIFVLLQLEAALSGRLVIAELLTSAIEAVYRGVLELFFLVGLRVVLRRWWLAVLIFVAVNGTLEVLEGIHPLVSWLTLGLGITGVSAFVLIRFGLLTYATALFCYLILIAAPLSLDLTAWFSETGFFILAAVAGIGAFGYWSAL
ncbi:MAG: serine/threonine-protein kinase, partial [Thermoanaerobaculia bacterium]